MEVGVEADGFIETEYSKDYGNQVTSPPKKKRRQQHKDLPAKAPSVHRPKLVHQRPVPLGVPMPRLTTSQLDSGDPNVEPFRTRTRPFILTDGLTG